MMASDPNRLRERAQRVLAENQSEVQRIVGDVNGVLDETDRQLEADRSHIASNPNAFSTKARRRAELAPHQRGDRVSWRPRQGSNL